MTRPRTPLAQINDVRKYTAEKRTIRKCGKPARVFLPFSYRPEHSCHAWNKIIDQNHCRGNHPQRNHRPDISPDRIQSDSQRPLQSHCRVLYHKPRPSQARHHLESPQNFRPAAPLPKRTRRHWAFRRTYCPFNRATEFVLLRFAAQCRLRAESSPSSPLASVCRFAPNEPRRSLGIPSRSRHASTQSAHPLLHHVPKATSRAQPNAPLKSNVGFPP